MWYNKARPMNKAVEIFKAWATMFNPNSVQVDLALERVQICESCEYKKISPMVHCELCDCPLKAKIYSPLKGACPAGKWDEIDEKHLNKQ